MGWTWGTPRWLVPIRCGLGAHAQELESLCGQFCSIPVSSPGPLQGMSEGEVPTKVRLVKAMVFPVVMYGCEIWTVKKAEHRRTDAFEELMLLKN